MVPGSYNEERKVWIIEEPRRDWYAVQDVARITGQGGPSIYSAIKRGTLIGYMVSNRTKVKHEDLVAYIVRRGASKTLATTTDQLIQKIMPDPDNKNGAASIASEVALERPLLNLDIFDNDDDEDDDSVEDVNAEGDFTNDPAHTIEIDTISISPSDPDPRDQDAVGAADDENTVSINLPG